MSESTIESDDDLNPTLGVEINRPRGTEQCEFGHTPALTELNNCHVTNPELRFHVQASAARKGLKGLSPTSHIRYLRCGEVAGVAAEVDADQVRWFASGSILAVSPRCGNYVGAEPGGGISTTGAPGILVLFDRL